MRKLQRLHAAVGDLAENAPEIIANPGAARGLEQALMEALVGCFAYREEHRNGLAHVQHALVMRRFRRVLEENPEGPLFIPDVCAAIGVSERTLRTCCQQHLAMSPRRYLRGNRAELFELAEEILHQVALFGTRPVTAALR